MLDSIGGLTSTELLAFGKDKKLVTTTLSMPGDQIDLLSGQVSALRKEEANFHETPLAADEHRFLAYEFQRLPMNDNALWHGSFGFLG
ncbi:hypothetical protein [Planctomycetes bacterium TBK1r]|uniref:hypothetical protein n=1 Tax=Stieleria magnilauensis TaxID=2527963 RepID=UPI0011A39CA7